MSVNVTHMQLTEDGDYVGIYIQGTDEIIGIHGTGEVCLAQDDGEHIPLKPGRAAHE